MSLVLIAILSGIVHAAACGAQSAWDGCAEMSTDNGSVVVSGERPGRSDNETRGNTGSTPADETVLDETCEALPNRCGVYEVVTRQTPSIDDVASFAPVAAPLTSEPDGFGIAGLPINLTTAARTHTRTGELFDEPVTVRFRPVEYRYDYDDGTSRLLAGAGRTWGSLDLPQFSPTDTTHVYAQPGTYSPAAITTFHVDVDFGTGWDRVPGSLTLASRTTIRILGAHTALVAHTCTENPRAAGC